MANLLDPQHVYFASRIIAQAASPDGGAAGVQKMFRQGLERAIPWTVCVDDSRSVWANHPDNVLQVRMGKGSWAWWCRIMAPWCI